MVKIIVNSAILISIILGLSSCKEIHRGIINSHLKVSYDPVSIRKVAVFSFNKAHFAPPDSGQLNDRIIDSMSEHINKKIINSIVLRNPDVSIISPSASFRKINNSGFASEWNDFVEGYYNYGVINKKILYKVSNSLGVDALLLGQLINVYQSDGNGWDTTGTTIVTVVYSILEVSTAMTIWEVTADGIVKREMDAKAPPINEAVDLAVDKVTQTIPQL